MSRKQIVMDGVKSYIVGATMTVPGVSGGSMAMVLGFYERLVSAVPELYTGSFRRAFVYLLICGSAGVLGALSASPLISYLLDNYNSFVMFFFLGAVAASIPMIYHRSRLTGRRRPYIFFSLIGIGLVVALGFIPSSSSSGKWGILIQILLGILVSVGFVLPGISTTHLLVILSLYDFVLDCLIGLDFLSLLPLAFGVILGVFLLTLVLKRAMENYPSVTFPVILGFVLGSIPSVFPGFDDGWRLGLDILFFVLGFSLIFFIVKEEE